MFRTIVSGFLALVTFSVTAQPAEFVQPTLEKFTNLYKQELGQTERCRQPYKNSYAVCSPALRNEGNAPFILHHYRKTDNVIVLFHGLSDSPFFLRSIALELYNQGYTVVVPLLPGHGLKDAEDDMKDSQLAERWQAHVDDVMALAPKLGEKVFIGGFSTGGALAVQQYLDAPDNIGGIVLFSGALALSDNAEGMSRIWGIKWVAKLIDGDYITDGPNPYKYPDVAGFAGLELMDIIEDIRDKFEQGKRIEVPLFAAHSEADVTTPIEGIDDLLNHTDSDNTFFRIDESYELCHADLVVSWSMIREMNFDKSRVANTEEQCAVPKANPQFVTMMSALTGFLGFYAKQPEPQKPLTFTE